MEYTKFDEVRVYGRIGTIMDVCYEMINSEETDIIHHYDVEINGEIYIVYPDEINTHL